MKVFRALFLIAAIAASACSGNFATGTGMPQTGPGLPPVGGTPLPAADKNGLPETNSSASP